MLIKFVEYLRSAAYRFCVRLWSSINGDWNLPESPDPWAEAELLEQGEENQDVRFLRLQLTKLRADNTELQNRANDWRAQFPVLLNMPEGQLQEIACRYEIREADSKSGWLVALDHCVFCGCGLETTAFGTRRDALLYVALLQVVGYRPKHNLSCPSCYEEYEKSIALPDE